MNNVICCPNCKKTFEIDEAGYAAIVAQVRTAEFDRELELIKNSYKENLEKELKEQQAGHEAELKKMEEVIDRYRDFKIRLDNKSLGESLEQFACMNLIIFEAYYPIM